MECHGMVTSILQVGKCMLILDREATGLAEDQHLSGRSGADAGTATSTAMGARYGECWGPV